MKKIDEYLIGQTNKKMLVVFPHPDDESVMAGGLIMRAISLGFEVTVLTITEGNRGKIHVSGKGRSVAEIRREEMAQAMSLLGVSDWVMWKFDDGKLKIRNVWKKRLRKFILATNPGVIVSYDLSGVTGHPDHISLAREVLKIVRGNPQIKLLWSTFEAEWRGKIVNMAVEKYLTRAEYLMEMGLRESFKKWRGAFSHKSQGLKGFMRQPWWRLSFLARTEWYSEAKMNKKYQFRYIPFRI